VLRMQARGWSWQGLFGRMVKAVESSRRSLLRARQMEKERTALLPRQVSARRTEPC